MNASLRYDIYLDGTLVRCSVPASDVEEIASELEMQGENIVDEIWDQHRMRIDLTSTTLLDEEDIDY